MKLIVLTFFLVISSVLKTNACNLTVTPFTCYGPANILVSWTNTGSDNTTNYFLNGIRYNTTFSNASIKIVCSHTNFTFQLEGKDDRSNILFTCYKDVIAHFCGDNIISSGEECEPPDTQWCLTNCLLKKTLSPISPINGLTVVRVIIFIIISVLMVVILVFVFIVLKRANTKDSVEDDFENSNSV